MDKIKIAYSKQTSEKLAVSELKTQLGDNCKWVLFFTASIYDPANLSQAFNQAFPLANTFGCSTAGELISGYLLENSIVAMGFTEEVFEDLHIEIIENLHKFSSENMKTVMRNFKDYYSIPINQMDMQKYFGIVFLDGSSSDEENILDSLGEYSNLVFVGGSAASLLNRQPVVFANRTYYYNTALIVLIKSKLEFGFELVQNVANTDINFIATKVDEEHRIIYELNGRPALDVYCESLGITSTEISEHFILHPLCFYIEHIPFIKSINSIVAKGGLKCFSSTKEGTKLYLMNTIDILEHTEEYLTNLHKRYYNIIGMLFFNCFERSELLKTDSDKEQYGKIFNNIQTIGFNTFGESYIGHNNLSATALVIDDKKIS